MLADSLCVANGLFSFSGEARSHLDDQFRDARRRKEKMCLTRFSTSQVLAGEPGTQPVACDVQALVNFLPTAAQQLIPGDGTQSFPRFRKRVAFGGRIHPWLIIEFRLSHFPIWNT